MRGSLLKIRRLMLASAVAGWLSLAGTAVAEDDWGGDLELFGWLPIIELELEEGSKAEITRDDIVDDLDTAVMWAVRVHKGRWSLTSDFIYGDISKKTDLALLPNLPSLARVSKGGLKGWIITPSLGYTILDNDDQKVDLYAGARYFWIELDATIRIKPMLPGNPTTTRQESPTVSNWDGIVGARGLYYLPGKWFIPYSVNAGTGDSDFTWEVQAGFGYRFSDVSALFGWRYLSYDIGSDTIIKELTMNGPFAGVVFHW